MRHDGTQLARARTPSGAPLFRVPAHRGRDSLRRNLEALELGVRADAYRLAAVCSHERMAVFAFF